MDPHGIGVANVPDVFSAACKALTASISLLDLPVGSLVTLVGFCLQVSRTPNAGGLRRTLSRKQSFRIQHKLEYAYTLTYIISADPVPSGGRAPEDCRTSTQASAQASAQAQARRALVLWPQAHFSCIFLKKGLLSLPCTWLCQSSAKAVPKLCQSLRRKANYFAESNAAS